MLATPSGVGGTKWWLSPMLVATGGSVAVLTSDPGPIGWLVLTVGIAAGLGWGWVGQQRLSTALDDLHRATAKILAGDLACRAGAGSGDRYGLSTDFDQVVIHLSGMMGMLAPVAKLLTIAGEELGIIGDTIAEGAQGTSNEATTIAASVQEVSTNIQLAAAASEQLRSSIQEIADTTSNASNVARQAVASVTAATTTIGNLGESSARIGAVIQTITMIAEQTNLLALNATIEAARAGDAGKGFAVVASEVKVLAQETARATEEITEMIGQIQTDSSGAVAAIGQVSRIIDEISESQLTISSAVEEQTLTTRQVTQTTQDISTQAQLIATAIATVVDLSNTNTDAAQRSRLAVREIARMGGQMERETGGLHFATTEVEGYFEVSWDRAANQLSDICVGMWSDETCDRYAKELGAAYLTSKPGWTFLVDFAAHPAQSVKVQATHEAMMAAAVRSGLTWCAFVAQNPLVAMQMQRLSDKTGFPVTYVASRDEAIAVLAQK